MEFIHGTYTVILNIPSFELDRSSSEGSKNLFICVNCQNLLQMLNTLFLFEILGIIWIEPQRKSMKPYKMLASYQSVS